VKDLDIRCDDPRVTKALNYLPVKARQDFPINNRMTYSVAGKGPYRIDESGDFLDQVETADDVLFVIYGRVHRRILDRYVLSGWVVLHGGLVMINGCRALLLGHKGSGKTTLSTSLLFSGHPVEGDEMILARNGQVLTFPRSFHFKPGIERHVPELAGRLGGLPKKKMGEDDLIAFDPTLFGFDWAITKGPIDKVVWVSPNHGKETSISALAPFAVIQRLLESSLGWGEHRDILVTEAARLGAAGGIELLLGDPKNATNALESAVSC
jgi:hypothetical protein